MVEPLPVKFKFSSRKFFPKLQPISRIESGKMSLSIDLYLIVSANSDHLLKLCCFWYWKKKCVSQHTRCGSATKVWPEHFQGGKPKRQARPFHISGSTIIYGSAKTGIGKPTQHSREENRGYGKLTKKIN
jgi:hypothetical protein